MTEREHGATPERFSDGAIELRRGRYQDVLADVDRVDLVCPDPPYSAKTHAGSDAAQDMGADAACRKALAYEPWTPDHVHEFVRSWAPRCSGWLACLTDDVLSPEWRRAYRDAGLYDFAPVPVLQHKPRLGGDGPGSCAVYLLVARPKKRRFLSWGSLPGWYHSKPEHAEVMGAKPIALMRAIVRDYSRPGDLICDPCAGGATTLLAARMEGRRALGSELDPITFAKARERIAHMPGERLGQRPLFGEGGP